MNAEGGATMGGDCCEELPMYAVNKKKQNSHEFHGKVYQFETSKRICIKVKIKKMK